MMKRLLSVGIVAALICCFWGSAAFGKPGSDPNELSAKPASSEKELAKRNEKVKADVLKLVADTKAGKVVPRTPSPFQQTKRNNMSTGAKIAIVAIIAGTVFLIFAVHAINSD
jgi:hypothetical protein